MAESNRGAKIAESFTIRGTNQVVRAGDCVLIRPSLHGKDKLLSVARVEKMTCCGSRGVVARIRWYYSPEESELGRRCFHGEKELLLSDHFDTRRADTFECKCAVHTLKEYSKLSNARPEDFFSRLEYKVPSRSIVPDRIPVYCTCGIPYNPDLPMLRCSNCKDRFHPSCVQVDVEQARNLDHFVCPNCVQKNFSEELSNAYKLLPTTKRKKINITGASVILGVPRDSAPIREGEDAVAKKGEEGKVDTTPRKLSRLDMTASSKNKSDMV